MPTSRKNLVKVDSVDGLLRSFFIDLPPDFRLETTRLQIFPLAYFIPHLRVPAPLNTASYSYLILQRKGSGTVQVNGQAVTVRSRAAMFVSRGSVVSLLALNPATTGWIVMYDDAIMARALRGRSIERVLGLRAAIPISAGTLAWIDPLCDLLARQAAIETAEEQPVCDHLFAALVERLLAEGGGESQAPETDRAQTLDRRFRRLVFEHAVAEGSVGFYAARLNVSENYLLRCVTKSSGRPPKDWIIDVRLMEAQKLLRTTDATVAEIAARSGFEDPSYFGRLFRRRFGMSPREFRTRSGQDLSE